MGKQNLAQRARAATRRGQQREAKKKVAAAEEARALDVKIQTRAREQAKEIFEQATRKIKEVSASGKSSMAVEISMWATDPQSPRTVYVCASAKELFEKEGLKAEVRVDRLDPHGSDPLFDHTVYSTYLDISW